MINHNNHIKNAFDFTLEEIFNNSQIIMNLISIQAKEI